MKLQLALKAEYFDAIRDGTKPEEYRLANAYWTKRIFYEGQLVLYPRTFSSIVLTKGYPKARQRRPHDRASLARRRPQDDHPSAFRVRTCRGLRHRRYWEILAMTTQEATSLSDLIEALQKAEGPSRELDVAICNAVIPLTGTYPWEAYHGCITSLPMKWGRTGDLIDSMEFYVKKAEEVTASIDAAVALSKQVFPDANCWGIDVSEGWIEAHVQRNGVPKGEHWAQFAEHKSSPAIALCLAVLHALKAKQVQP